MRHREVQSLVMATHVAGWETAACLTASPGPLPILPAPKREGLSGQVRTVVLHTWSWGLSRLLSTHSPREGFNTYISRPTSYRES